MPVWFKQVGLVTEPIGGFEFESLSEAAVNCESYSWDFTSAITNKKLWHHGKKEGYQ